MEYYLDTRNNKSMQFIAMRGDLESVILGEVRKGTIQSDLSCDI